MASAVGSTYTHVRRSDLLDNHPYIAQSRRVECDNTVLQSLLALSCKRAETQASEPADGDAAEDAADAAPLCAPSLSASERIKAWETVVPHPLSEEVLLRSPTAHFDASGMDLISDDDHNELLHSTPYRSSAQGDTSVAQVPFNMRVCEVEQRFREQMEVHRGLTRAGRQLQLAERSVQVLCAERRTHAVLRAIQERQEALWKQVWPDGNMPELLSGETLQTGVWPSAQPAVKTLPRTPTAAAAATMVPATPTSPASAASPTSNLLQDILNTFSKPRELRGKRSAADMSGAASSVSKNENTREKAQTTARRGSGDGGVGAGVDNADAVEPFPRPPRVTASGAAIFFPPRRPRPYVVIRYAEVQHRNSPISAKHSVVAAAPAGLLRTATSATHTSSATTTSPSDISEEHSPGDVDRSPATADDSSSVVESVVSGHHVGVRSRSGSEATSSIEDDVSSYSSDTFEAEEEEEEVEEEDGSPKDGARRGSVSSSVSSAPQSAQTSFTSTESVVEEDVDENTRPRRRHWGSFRQLNRKQPPPVATADEVVERFIAACESVNAAATQLLHSPGVRKQNTQAALEPAAVPSSSKSPTSMSTSLASSSSSSEARGKGATVNQVGAASQANAAPSGEGWRESLERQLRNVRHLRRFRDHLLRHIEAVDRHRKANRETQQLLQEARALAKVRRTLLRQPSGKGGVDVQQLLKKVKGTRVKRSRGLVEAQEQWKHHTAPSSALHRAGAEDDISDEVATELPSDVDHENSSALEEDIAEEFSVSDAMEDAASDSVDDEVEDAWEALSGGHDSVSESFESVEEDMTAADDRSGRRVSDSASSTVKEEYSGDSAGGERRDIHGMAGEGLDEIEEELADHLAELSSSALSSRSSVPSDVEELIDLLPSSLIPSEVADEVDGSKGGQSGSASVHTESAVATETDTSAAELQSQQRRVFVAVKRGAGVDEGERDNKAYIQDSMASTVFTASNDADVDTTPSSANSSSDEDTFTESESDSTDALTALETDMALTKQRRRAALRSVTAVPTFDQLYNPSTPAVQANPSALEDTAVKGGTKQSSAVGEMASDSRGEGEKREVSASASCALVADTEVVEDTEDVVKEGAAQGRSPLRAGIACEAAPTKEAQTRLNAEDAAIPAQQPAVSDTAAASSMPARRASYAKEDLVAQSAWKARQLRLLRQLRSLSSVEDTVLGGTENDDGDAASSIAQTQQRQHERSKSSLELAMDAAEDAAREEWAQHWGVLESLLQTRFASPRYEQQMAPLCVSPARGACEQSRLRRPDTSSCTTSTNDASRSS